MQTDPSRSLNPSPSSPPLFGVLLRGHRHAAGLTQAELAERAGLSWRGVISLERGERRSPHRDTVARLAAALGLSDTEHAALLAAARPTRSTASMPALLPEPTLAAAAGSVGSAHTVGTDAHASQSTPHHLHLLTTPLLGREREVAEICSFLQEESVRLVTLTGPAGVGKTRLGMEVAAALAGAFVDGIWFIPLAPVADPDLVVPTIAHTVGLQDMGRQSVSEALREWLRSRRLLLLLDNCEQVLAAAHEIAELLTGATDLHILATSRAPLHLRGEQEYPVSPLPLPPPLSPLFPADLAPTARGRAFRVERWLLEAPAMALFVARARAIHPTFTLTAQTAEAIAGICARLDGLPLAIELAAARVRLLSPVQLLARLEPRLPLLIGGARDLEARQQTMRMAIGWSEALLTPAERRLFRRLAVFVGGFTVEAVEAVCATPEGTAPLGVDVLEGLEALVNQSLVQQPQQWRVDEEAGAGAGGGNHEKHFRLLYIIREYALGQLEAGRGEDGVRDEVSTEAEALRRAHATYFLSLVEGRELAMYGPDAVAWLNRLEQEYDNFRAALSWAREQGEMELGLRLAAALVPFWDSKGYLGEGRGWLDGLLVQTSDVGLTRSSTDGLTTAASTMTRAKALLGVGMFARRAGEYEQARNALEASLALAAGQRPGWVAALALGQLGHLARRQGNIEQAAAFIKNGLALLQASGEPVAGLLLSDLGHISQMRGDLDQATVYLEESLTLARRIGADFWAGFPLSGLAQVALLRGDLDQSAAYFEESLAICRRVGSDFWAGFQLFGLSHIARLQGDLAGATRLAREQLITWRGVSVPRYLARCLEGIALIAAAAKRGTRAARLLGAAAALRATVGELQAPHWRAEIEREIACARVALGESRWSAAFAAGRALSLEEAMAEALEDEV
ncbi:MAG TPA: tetratricopeptide repeat protein [Ktedonobacterales bacterium]